MFYKISDIEQKKIKILIIKISSAGDIIHSTAVITGLYKYLLNLKDLENKKGNNFDFQIDTVIDPQYLKLVQDLNIYTNFFFYDEIKYIKILSIIRKKPYLIFKNLYLIFKDIIKVINTINKINYDFIFDLQGIEKSLIFYFLCKGKYKNCKWSLPYKYLKENKSMHAVDAMAIVIKKYFKEFTPNKITINIKENLILNRLKNNKKDFIIKLIENGNYVTFSPFTRWNSKNLPLIYYIIFSYYLKEKHNINSIFLGSKSEREIFLNFLTDLLKDPENFLVQYYKSNIVLNNSTNFLINFLNIDLKSFIKIIENDTQKFNFFNNFENYLLNNNAFILIGLLDLDEVPLIIKNSNFFVGSDSMNLFIADSLEVKNLAFFGPTFPERVAPYNTKNTQKSFIYQKKELDCIKCYKRDCPKLKNDFMRCLYEVNFNEIIRIFDKLIN